MALKEEISQNLKEAMKAQDELKTSVLRMLISAVKNYEIAKGGAGYTASDEEVLGVVQKEIKQRGDSIESFKAGNRPEMAEKETQEMRILQGYLPPQMAEDELRSLVKAAVSSSAASSMAQMGQVMGVLMPQVKGKADPTLVSQLVKEELSR